MHKITNFKHSKYGIGFHGVRVYDNESSKYKLKKKLKTQILFYIKSTWIKAIEKENLIFKRKS